MFKGLKTKIAEETKKIQEAVVSQVGEGFTNLTKRSELNSGSNQSSPALQHKQGNMDLSDAGLIQFDDWSNSTQHSAPATPASYANPINAEIDGLPRQRHASTDSFGSLDNFFPSLGQSTQMSTILSDVETDMESAAGSSYSVSSASREQISSVLNKLQGRAASYKDKFRQLVSAYKLLANENEKIRSVMTISQDKALKRMHELREEKKMCDRAKRELEQTLRSKILAQDGALASLKHQFELMIEGKSIDEDVLKEHNISLPSALVNLSTEKEKIKKLEELLQRCKESIKSYKDKTAQLTTENERLSVRIKEMEHDQGAAEGMSDFVTERTLDEYKQKLKTCEDSFKLKLDEEAERSALALAHCKQEMHREIEKKEQLIEQLRLLMKAAETSNADKLKGLEDELKRKQDNEQELEREKNELVQQLSHAKQAAVQIVKEEEEKKRKHFEDEFQRSLLAQATEFEAKFEKLKQEYESAAKLRETEFDKILKEREEQMQLALEERDLQKMAALAAHDQKNDALQSKLETLTTEKLQLESRLDQLSIEHAAAMQSLQKKLKCDHDSLIVDMQKQFDCKTDELNRTLNSKDQSVEKLKEQEFDEKIKEFKIINAELKRENETLTKELEQINSLKRENDRLNVELRSIESEKLSIERQSDQTVKSLEKKIAKLAENLESTEKEKCQLRSVLNSTVQPDCDRANDDESIENLHDQISALTEARDRLIGELDEKNNIINSLQFHAEETEKLLTEAMDAEKSLQDNLSAKDSDVRQAVSNSEKLKNELVRKNAEICDLHDALDEAKRNLTIKEAELSTVGQNLGQVKNELNERSNSELIAVDGLRREHTVALNECKEKDRKIEDLGLANSRLEEEIKSLKRDTDKLLTELRNELNSKHNELNRILKSEQAAAEIKSKLEEELERSRRRAENEEADYCVENSRLKTEISRLELQMSDAKSELDRTTENWQSAKNAIIGLNDQVESLRRDLSESANQKAALEEKIDQIESLKRNLSESTNQKAAAIEELNDRVESLERDLSESTNQKAALAENFRLESNRQRSIIQELEEKIQTQQRRLNDCASNENLKSEMESLRRQISEKEQTIDALKEEKSASQDKQALLKKKYDAILKDLRLELNSKNEQVAQHDDVVKILNNKNSSLQESLEKSQSELNRIADLVKRKNAEISSYASGNESLAKQLHEKSEKVIELTKQVGQKSNEIDRCTNNLSEMEKQNKAFILELENELGAKKSEIERLNDTVILLNSNLERIEKELDLLKQNRSTEGEYSLERAIASDKRWQDAKDQLESLERQLIDKQIALEEAQNDKLALEDKQAMNQRKTENALRTLQSENKKLAENCRTHEEKWVNYGTVQRFSSISLDHPGVIFAEPAEAEYLRNIVFRYMVERESLGKESMNLAKAIAAVLKLNMDQTREILEKEEARCHSWFLPTST